MCLIDYLFGGRVPKALKKFTLARYLTGEGKPTKSFGVHEFTVQKPYCCPAEPVIRNTLENYGVPILNYSERTRKVSLANYAKLLRIELKHFENLKFGPAAVMYLPLACEAKVQVPASQARWAEYLLESSGKVAVTGGRIDSRNRTLGNRRDGRMPTPWDAPMARGYARVKALQPPGDGRAWLESGCSEGRDVWQQVQTAVKKSKGANHEDD